MQGPHRPRESPALDWSHTAQNQERSRKRRYLSEDLELAPKDDSGIANELAGLAAIQLLKSFLVARRDLCCLDLAQGEARKNHNQRPQVATDGVFARFSGTLGRGENPWIYGLEQDSDPQYTSPVHRNSVWDIGYDGPQSICSDKSTANNYCDDSTNSAEHKHEWWKPSTVSVRKLASQSEPFLFRNPSWTEKDAEMSGEDPGARPMTPSLSRPGNTPPPQKLSPDNISCHNLEHETSYAQLAILRLQDSPHSLRHDARKSRGPFGSLKHRLRRSRSLFADPGTPESPYQNPRERRRRSRDLTIYDEPGIFQPTSMFSGYRPNLIALAGVMMATGVLNRLSSRTNRDAREGTDDRGDGSLNESVVSSPPGQPNTPVLGSVSPAEEGLKLTKGLFPTVAPANSPVSGSGTPNPPDSLRGSSRRGRRIGPSRLSEGHTPEDYSRDIDRMTASGSELDVPRPTEQKNDQASSRSLAASAILRDTENAESNGPVSPHEPPKSPRLGPSIPSFRSAEEFRMWKHASKLRQRTPSPSGRRTPSPLRSPSPLRTTRPGIIKTLGDMHEMLNEKQPPSL